MTAVPLDGDRLDALERLAEAQTAHKAARYAGSIEAFDKAGEALEDAIGTFVARVDLTAFAAEIRASWAEVERLTVALAAQIGLYRSAEQDVTRLENAMSETDHLEVPVGSIVAYPNGTPWMLRQDGWYVGDAKQPNAALELIGVVLLRRGWTG